MKNLQHTFHRVVVHNVLKLQMGEKEKTKIVINEDESETMEKEEYFLRKRRNISVTITKFSLEVLLL